MDGRSIPADHLWLVLAGEHDGQDDRYGSGYRATDGHHDAVIVTRAERKSEQVVTDESGLTPTTGWPSCARRSPLCRSYAVIALPHSPLTSEPIA